MTISIFPCCTATSLFQDSRVVHLDSWYSSKVLHPSFASNGYLGIFAALLGGITFRLALYVQPDADMFFRSASGKLDRLTVMHELHDQRIVEQGQSSTAVLRRCSTQQMPGSFASAKDLGKGIL